MVMCMYLLTIMVGMQQGHYTVPDVEIFELFWIEVVNLSGHIQYVLHSVEKYTQ